eukprot:9496233-Pyramimonas_sp.AAC.1
MRAYTRIGSQSHERREHIPGSGANHTRGESIYPSSSSSPSSSSRMSSSSSNAMPASPAPRRVCTRTNRVREESIYPEREPITREERAYTRCRCGTGIRIRAAVSTAAMTTGICSLLSCDWLPIRVCALSSRVIGSRSGYMLFSLTGGDEAAHETTSFSVPIILDNRF